MTHPLRSTGITPLQHYKETGPPLAGSGCECHIVAKLSQAFDQAVGLLAFGSVLKVIGAEVLIQGSVLSQGAPFRRRLDRRLPALSSLRGQRPAQEMRWPSDGKRLMSVPISETITCAPMSLMPGTDDTCSTAARKGAMPASTCRSIVAMAASRASI